MSAKMALPAPHGLLAKASPSRASPQPAATASTQHAGSHVPKGSLAQADAGGRMQRMLTGLPILRKPVWLRMLAAEKAQLWASSARR
jgi:hypothetical protein